MSKAAPFYFESFTKNAMALIRRDRPANANNPKPQRRNDLTAHLNGRPTTESEASLIRKDSATKGQLCKSMTMTIGVRRNQVPNSSTNAFVRRLKR